MAIQFEWTEEMSVGEANIDSQHQRLLSQLNKVIATMIHGSSSKEVEEALSFFEQYVTTHLDYEEEYMERRGFVDLESHKHTHQEFRNAYTDFKAKLSAGHTPDDVLVGIEEFLGRWWVEHIGQEDHKYFLALGAAV